MRIASKLERTSLGLEPKAKYYIIPEGEKTEIQYFCGVKDNREELNIKPLIEIIPIENDEDEKGQSHPKEKIRNFDKDLKDGKFTFDKDIDKVCFVVDRDKQNVSEEQLNEFIKFKPNIKKAIINEKKFCEDLEGLKNKLGSNVGILLDSIIDD